MILRDKFLDELGRLHSKLFWEVVAKDLNTDVADELLSQDQAVDVLVVEAGLENEEVHLLPFDDAVEALVDGLDRLHGRLVRMLLVVLEKEQVEFLR